MRSVSVESTLLLFLLTLNFLGIIHTKDKALRLKDLRTKLDPDELHLINIILKGSLCYKTIFCRKVAFDV